MEKNLYDSTHDYAEYSDFYYDFQNLVFFGIYVVNKPIGSALLITGLNFSLLILFLVSVVLFWNKTAKDFEVSEIKANT